MIGEELRASDPETYERSPPDERRQGEKIRGISSENYVSKAAIEASSSVLTHKYGEGYPGRRYGEGQITARMDRVITDAAASDENAEKVLGEVREPTRKFPAPGISV